MSVARPESFLPKLRLPAVLMVFWPVPELSMVPLPGMTLHVGSACPADGPLTFLLHGFSESRFAWRWQIGPLAAAGLRVLAPGLRGDNRIAKPLEISTYHLDHAELTALLTE